MDEVVETSDPEELEELRAARPQNFNPPPIRVSPSDDRQSPRKRPKLHHEYSDIVLRIPPRSRSSSSAEAPSPRFQSTSSPASLTRASSPKLSSPVATPPISVTDPSISPQFAIYDAEDLFTTYSQDPLLLGGTAVSPKSEIRTPNGSPPASRGFSPDYDEPMAEPDHPIIPSTQRLRSESVDPLDLLLFTPSRPSVHDESVGPPVVADSMEDDDGDGDIVISRPHVPSSPLSPPPAESPRGSPVPPEHPDDLAIAQALTDKTWNLRARKPKQIRPYSDEYARYRRTMRHNEEAMVKTNSLKGHRAREEDYEEDQTQEMDGYEAENDDPSEERRSLHSRHKNKSLSPGIRPPSMPATDEEEESAFDVLRKEGRKRREQKDREVTRKHGRKRARPFPLKDLNDADEGSPSRSRPARHRSDSSSSLAIGRRISQKSPPRMPGSPASPVISRAPSLHPLTPVFRHARASPPLLFNNSDDDMDVPENDSFLPSPHVPKNDPGTPIVVSDDESNNGSDANDETVEQVDNYVSEPEVLSKEEKKQRRRIRALNRLYPAFMRDQMMKDAAQGKRSTKRQRSATVSSEEDDEPLLPGQTRVRRAANPRDLRDVKGDSESEDDQMVDNDNNRDDSMDADEGPAASDMDIQVVWPQRKRRARAVSLRPSSEEEEVLSDGKIDDERIEAYLREAPLRGSGLQEKDMIDWMLDNTAEVGGTRRQTTRASSTKAPRSESSKKVPRAERSKRPKISITTGGARKGRQTRLTFGQGLDRGRPRDRTRAHSPRAGRGTAAPAPREGRKRGPVQQTVLILGDRSRTPPRSHRRRSHSSPEGVYIDHTPLFDADEVPPSPPPLVNPRSENVHQMPHAEVLRKATRKQKEKERKARMKMHGVHVFPAPEGSRITGQRVRGITIDVDPGFHRALAPVQKRQQLATTLTKSKIAPKLNNAHAEPKAAGSSKVKNKRLMRRGDRPAAPADAEPDDAREESPPLATPPDLAERDLLLDFGISMHGSKIKFGGDTYTGKGRLNELINPPAVPPVSHFCSVYGFDMGPDVTAPQFLAIFGRICDRLYEFATGLPDNEDEANLKGWISFLGATCRVITSLLAAGEETTLKDDVESHILRLTSKMREASLTAESIDSTTFTVCWFAVEMSIRSGFRLPAGRPSKPNVLQEACIVLVNYLMEYGLERGMEPLIGGQDVGDGSTTAHQAFEAWVGIWHVTDKYRDPTAPANPLWKMVQTALAARQTDNMTDLEASENAWRAIISLSTISQSSPRPHGSPDASDAPCRPTCWDIVLFALERIRLEATPEGDETISESSSDAHGRYIRLLAERCCLLWSKWQWSADDAFNVLNRLFGIFRSRKFANLRHEKAEFPDFLRVNDWTLLSRPIHTESTFVLFLKLVYQTLLVNTSKVKKLLSLATPVGSLPWSKAHPPSIHDLSMLFNRFTVITIAIHIDPSSHARWIQLARGYVKFKDADATTRHAHIRGWMYLTIVMVRRGIQLDEALGWLGEMVNVLMDEHKRETGPIVVLGIHALVGSVRNVIRAFRIDGPENSVHDYPDPRLLLALEPILRDGSIVKENNASAHIVPRLIRSFLSVRALAVPAPKRPPPPPAVLDPESQDEYGALAFDQDLIAALDQPALYHEAACKAKDLSLCKLLEVNMCWTLFRQLVVYVQFTELKESFKKNDRVSTDIASLTGCWLGCGNIVVQNSAKTWPVFLNAYETTARKKVGPGFCERRMDFLVCSNVLMLDPMSYLTLQDNFLVVFFESLASWHTTSEDDYIKLLLSIDGLQHSLLKGASWEPSPEKDEIGLLTARLPLVEVILSNLSDCLAHALAMDEEDNRRYVGYCIKMFSAMKNIDSELENDPQARATYASWCKHVYGIYQTHPNIVAESRLDFWMRWAENLGQVSK
ncbi:Mus7/MMS22 family-domain-containing protein [Mycena rosella]|uniref:Mus7/MMS22 family-domain-containing protein n=1 Tax=Mycena rosella TaxID=1033263 RepID=A0AAD7GLU2_MYCRO|nr:Mus7/MMS22 family-domain-containing protein [Mycena rosella]